MKRNLLFTLMALLPIVANAYNAKIDGIYYNFSGENATVTSDGTNSYTGEVVIPESVIYNGGVYRVTSIGYRAFYGCSDLKDVFSYKMSPQNISMGSDVFIGIQQASCYLHIPCGYKLLYQQVAQWNDFPNIVEMAPSRYDLNVDGVVNRADYTLLVTRIADGAVYNSQYDLDGNGQVDVLDANLLLEAIE